MPITLYKACNQSESHKKTIYNDLGRKITEGKDNGNYVFSSLFLDFDLKYLPNKIFEQDFI